MWEVEESKHNPGMVEHTVGWPLVRLHLTHKLAFLFKILVKQALSGSSMSCSEEASVSVKVNLPVQQRRIVELTR